MRFQKVAYVGLSGIGTEAVEGEARGSGRATGEEPRGQAQKSLGLASLWEGPAQPSPLSVSTTRQWVTTFSSPNI